jgi:hypothetical protein
MIRQCPPYTNGARAHPSLSSSVRFYECLLLLTSTLRTAQLCIGIARPRALGFSSETNSAVVGCTRNCLVLAWIQKTWNNWISDNLGGMEAKDLYHLWSVELFNLASQLVDHQAIMKQDRFHRVHGLKLNIIPMCNVESALFPLKDLVASLAVNSETLAQSKCLSAYQLYHHVCLYRPLFVSHTRWGTIQGGVPPRSDMGQCHFQIGRGNIPRMWTAGAQNGMTQQTNTPQLDPHTYCLFLLVSFWRTNS